MQISIVPSLRRRSTLPQNIVDDSTGGCATAHAPSDYISTRASSAQRGGRRRGTSDASAPKSLRSQRLLRCAAERTGVRAAGAMLSATNARRARLLDFHDVHVNFLAGLLLSYSFELVDLGNLTAETTPGRGEDGDAGTRSSRVRSKSGDRAVSSFFLSSVRSSRVFP